MKRVSVTDLKNGLSRVLRLVKRGETVEILERSVPIARIESVGGRSTDDESRLQRLIRDGVVSPAKVPVDPDIVLKFKPIPCKVDVVKVLIEERGDR
jgi:antitoxin (DNA-binding transcriptional repressor) of toxin-antitoxin stability system